MLSRASTLLALALPGLMGCAEPPRSVLGGDGWGPTDEEAPGREDLSAAPRARTIPPDKRKRWSRAGVIRSLRQLGGRTPSEHFDGRYDRTVLVNELAVPYEHLTASTQLAAGALIVQRHHRRGVEGTSVYFVMEKLDDGTWRFVVLDESLRVASRGALAACARCHIEAPFNGLFGIIPADE